MAKKSKKNKTSQQAARLSPVEYMRQKARTLPLGKCYMGRSKTKENLLHAVVTRVRPSGNIVACIFCVETLCFGVTDAFCRVNMTPEEWKETLADYTAEYNLREVPYEEVHNLLYGAIEFAEADGLPLPKELDTAEHILEEDTDDIPMSSYEFGRDGKHFIMFEKFDADAIKVIRGLSEVLGDKFHYDTAPLAEMRKKRESYLHEPHHYDYPDYPEAPGARHRDIADALLDPANLYSLPAGTAEAIMALAPDEAAADLGSVILYEIGQTYRKIADKAEDIGNDAAIIHALIFLSAIDSTAAGFDAVREILRQSDEFVEAHLGDYATDLLPQALMRQAGNDIEAIAVLLDTPGIVSFNRFYIFKALWLKYREQPESRGDIMAVAKAHLKRLATDLARASAGDAEYAGLIMSLLEDMRLHELLPEIKAIFDTGQVDETICGDYSSVAEEMKSDTPSSFREMSVYTVDEYYAQLDRSRQIAEREG